MQMILRANLNDVSYFYFSVLINLIDLIYNRIYYKQQKSKERNQFLFNFLLSSIKKKKLLNYSVDSIIGFKEEKNIRSHGMC
jgi:hypothetical protein